MAVGLLWQCFGIPLGIIAGLLWDCDDGPIAGMSLASGSNFGSTPRASAVSLAVDAESAASVPQMAH